jgi:hypothetical protein
MNRKMIIIQNVLERKDSMAECCRWASERACVTSPLFGQGKIFFFLMDICNSLLLLKSLPNHLTLRKWCYTRLQHNFPLDPMISSFHIHFGTLLLLKSLPINIINCIKFYVNCSALTGAYDWQ